MAFLQARYRLFHGIAIHFAGHIGAACRFGDRRSDLTRLLFDSRSILAPCLFDLMQEIQKLCSRKIGATVERLAS